MNKKTTIEEKELLEEINIEEPVETVASTPKRKKKYKILSYNAKTNMLVFERDGVMYQSTVIEYDGSGFVEM